MLMSENALTYFQILRGILAMPMSASAKVVWLYIRDRQGKNKRCWPSLTTICRDCNLAKGTVLRVLGELQKNNVLEIKHPAHPSKKVKASNHYTATLTGLNLEPVKGKQSLKGSLTGLKTEPVQAPTGSNMDHQPVQELNPNVLNRNVLNTKAIFDEARKAYPGTKRGLDHEFENFQKKHKDFKAIVDLLLPAIEREDRHKKSLKAGGVFCPQWKHFQTWINNGCWTLEFSTDSQGDEPDYASALDQYTAPATEEKIAELERAGVI